MTYLGLGGYGATKIKLMEAGVAYDSSRFRGDAVYSHEAEDDDGFRDSPKFRDSVAYHEERGHGAEAPEPAFGGGYALGDYRSPEPEFEPDQPVSYLAPSDTPYRVPRDRLSIHFGWELVLALGVAAIGFILNRRDATALRGSDLNTLLITATITGFIAVGMALSLRAAVPNLALGPMTYAASFFFAENSERGLLITAGVTGLIAAAVGIAIAVVVTLFRVPAWAASLAAALGLILWIQVRGDPANVVNGAYRLTEHPQIWFGGFVAVSVVGGVLGLIPRVRNAVGRYRPAAERADRGEGGAVAAALALVASSVFAAVAGVLLALQNRAVSPTENGLAFTGLALGAVLLGGTSVYGRLGGLFGTVLAVVGMTLIVKFADVEGWILHSLGLAAATIAIGLFVTRIIETFGRARPAAVAGEPAHAYSGPYTAISGPGVSGPGVSGPGVSGPGGSGPDRFLDEQAVSKPDVGGGSHGGGAHSEDVNRTNGVGWRAPPASGQGPRHSDDLWDER